MITTSPTLQNLMIQIANGDTSAFEELYSATNLKLFGIIRRILKRPELAEEILQEVYVKIWERAGDYDSNRASPITWMAIIARNRALDEARRRQLLMIDDDDAVANVPDTAATPDEEALLSAEFQRLRVCLQGLEPDRREAIERAYLEGFSRMELAEKFDQPLGTIKTWLHRGLKQLRKCLEQ